MIDQVFANSGKNIRVSKKMVLYGALQALNLPFEISRSRINWVKLTMREELDAVRAIVNLSSHLHCIGRRRAAAIRIILLLPVCCSNQSLRYIPYAVS